MTFFLIIRIELASSAGLVCKYLKKYIHATLMKNLFAPVNNRSVIFGMSNRRSISVLQNTKT